MQNELKYTVRSREIVDLMSSMRNSRLILTPYFQRNLVWRDAHKRDFIDTILKGYPFPQIFLARGPLNLETLEASQAVVDGQQRLNTIRQFIEGKLEVEGKLFRDFSSKQREDFLKYEVAVIDFDLDADDKRLKDIFHRLNRTYYSLSAIEKLASEYSASEFMLIARVLCGEITKHSSDEIEDELTLESEELGGIPEIANVFSRDPGVDDGLWAWLMGQADGDFSDLVRTQSIFTSFEFDRKIPLMFTLNVMCTYLSGYYQRNDKVRTFLDAKATDFSERDKVIFAINRAARFIGCSKLPSGSIWWSKANFFTLIVELARLGDTQFDSLSPESTCIHLTKFASEMPSDYALAAREAVSRKAQRELRGKYVRDLLNA